MLEYLDSPAYRRLVADFQAFLSTPGAARCRSQPGCRRPIRCAMWPRGLIFTRYEAVRARISRSSRRCSLTTHHALRIDFKRLRTSWSSSVNPGPETPDLIKTTVAMQDLLGVLEDAYVAEGLIGGFGRAESQAQKRYAGGELADVEADPRSRQRAAEQTLVAGVSRAVGRDRRVGFRRALAWRLLRCGRLICSESLDPVQKLKRKEWESTAAAALSPAQGGQAAASRAGMPVIVLFEGWDVAGKGPCIAALTQALDPRGLQGLADPSGAGARAELPLALALLDETAAARGDRDPRPELDRRPLVNASRVALRG